MHPRFFVLFLSVVFVGGLANFARAATTPTITWSPGSAVYGTPLGSNQLRATAGGVPGTFVYSPAAGTVLPPGTHTLSVSFTPTDTVTYNSVPSTTRSFTVSPRSLSVTGFQVQSREYDGSTSLSYTGTPTVSGVLAADAGNVSLSGTLSIALVSKAAGSFRSTWGTGVSLTGSAASKYYLIEINPSITIARRTVSVSGSVTGKVFDGSSAASVTLGSLSNVVPGDSVSLTTAGMTATFNNADAGANKPVTVSGVALGGSDASNYQLASPLSLSGTISPAPVRIEFSNNVHPYDGGPKTATITAFPQAALTVTYTGTVGTDFPRNAGTYNITVIVADGNHTGAGVGTLTITKAGQDLSFSITGNDLGAGSTMTLDARANTGLPVTFSLVSGNGTLSGNRLSVPEIGTVVVRATQEGDANHAPVSAERTFVARKTQSIRFSPPTSHRTTEGSISLSAAASSGLPVAFTVASGPATVSGTTVTFTGASGKVAVRATQGGDATYAPAPEVTWVFAVSNPIPDTFFGDIVEDSAKPAGATSAAGSPGQAARLDAKVGDIAATFDYGTGQGNIMLVAPSLDLALSLGFEATAEGAYSIPFTAGGRSLTLAGTVSAGSLMGRIGALGLSFTVPIQARTGATAPLAGFYFSSGINSASGGASTIVGPQGQLLVVAATGSVTAGSSGRVAADGSFAVTTSGTTVAGTIDAVAGLSGTITASNQAPLAIAGLPATATRTDRVVNLSSRARISAAEERTFFTGFVIGGTEKKRVLLRAVGPALAGFGVSDALVNPALQIFDGNGSVVVANDDWTGSTTSAAAAQAGAFSLAPGSRDAAVVAELEPGAYTMQITALDEKGIALAEIYDAGSSTAAEPLRLLNISSRSTVEPGEGGALIGGFVVTGNVPKKVLIRGIGPTLGAFGVYGTLADPRLALYSGATLLAQNDDWQKPSPLDAQHTAATAAEVSAAARSVGAFALDAGSKDASILIMLAPGAYTAQVSGATTGVALVEIYEVP